MTIRIYVDVGPDCPPDRLWLARIERGTTATTVFAPTQAEARSKAEAAVARERELQERLRAAAKRERKAAADNPQRSHP
jgi:hypothetical protein